MKKALTLVLAIIGLNLIYIQDANASAVSYQGCNLQTVTKAPQLAGSKADPSYVPLKDYLANMSGLSSNCQQKATDYYNQQTGKLTADLAKAQLQSFNKRYDVCTNGSGSLFNPRTWGTSIKCLFTVSFLPNSTAFKDSYDQLTTDFKTHQPTSYVAIAGTTLKGVVDNWGGMTCNSDGIPFSFKFASTDTKTVDMKIACNPPSAIVKLQKFMVLGLWIGFALLLYQIVNRKLGEML